MTSTLLVVAAHPDDEVLGAGATMAKFHDAGWKVHAAVLGTGLTSRGETAPDDLQSLATQMGRACSIVGATSSQGDLPDNRFDSVDLLEVVQIVEALIDKHRPSIILTHWSGDLNIDHQVTSRAVVTATRPQPNHAVTEVLAFEVPSATEWAFGQGAGFRPNVFHDVSNALSKKLQALECYEGEMRESPHPRSLENVERLARLRGAQAGYHAAEAFECLRALRSADSIL